MSCNLFGIPQPDGGEYAYVSLATQADLNNAPVQFRDVQFNVASLQTNMAGVAATVTELTGIPLGIYLLNGSLTITSNAQRANLLVRYRVNGVVGAVLQGGSGYVRAASGHNTSTIHLNGVLQVNAASNVGMSAVRESVGGIVISNGAFGQFSLVRLA